MPNKALQRTRNSAPLSFGVRGTHIWFEDLETREHVERLITS